MLLTCCSLFVRNEYFTNFCCIFNISIANVNSKHALMEMPPKNESLSVRIASVTLHLVV